MAFKKQFDALYQSVANDLQKMQARLEKDLKNTYTCETILNKLKSMNFADIQGQGYIPLYIRDKLTDELHAVCGFNTDYQFITKSQMRTIQKKSKGR